MRSGFTTAAALLRHVPIGLGDRRAAAEVFRRTAAPPPGRVRLSNGTSLALDPADWPQAQTWLLRRYDVSTVRFIVDHLPPKGGVFVDGGAHVGLVSYQVAALCPPVSIHAFEPHLAVAAAHERNGELNPDARVMLCRTGLSSRDGTLSFDPGTHALGDGSLEVPVVRLDGYLDDHGVERVDVLKLDVEGHEFDALRGAEQSLRSGRIRAVTLEAMDEHGDVVRPAAFLQEMGFRRVPLPDPRPPWVARLRRFRPENCGFVCGT